MWTVQLTAVAAAELGELAEDQRAHFMRIRSLIQGHGLERVRYPHVEHLQGPLWEMRMKGASAADLKFLHRLPQALVRNFKSKAALES